MTKEEVLLKISAAQLALREYKKTRFTVEPEVKGAFSQLLYESKAQEIMGPSGGTCGCCNGTGRA